MYFFLGIFIRRQWFLIPGSGLSCPSSSQNSHFQWCCCCCCWVASVVFDSVWPHRLQPTKLPCPWDFPGKNTGMGCHFLLQCMKGKSESEFAESWPTLSDPMDRSLPGSSADGIFKARVLEWVATMGNFNYLQENLFICNLDNLNINFKKREGDSLKLQQD